MLENFFSCLVSLRGKLRSRVFQILIGFRNLLFINKLFTIKYRFMLGLYEIKLILQKLLILVQIQPNFITLYRSMTLRSLSLRIRNSSWRSLRSSRWLRKQRRVNFKILCICVDLRLQKLYLLLLHLLLQLLPLPLG